MNKKKGKLSEWGLKWMLSVIAVFFLLLLFSENSYSQTGDLKRFSITPMPEHPEGVAVFRDHPDKAGIIIESPTTNLSFSSNMDGIVDQRSEPGRGRYVLIIEPFTQIIVVDAPGYIQGRFRVGNPGVRDVLYYEIEPEERTPDLISVIFNVEPDDARLFVDNQQTETNRTVQLSPGSAEVRLERESYRTILDAITINPDNIQFNYVLSEVDIVPVRFSANTPGARVLIDGVEQGIIDDSGNFGVFLYPGQYSLSIQLSGYLPQNATIDVTEEEANQFDFQLEQNIGGLQIDLTPTDAQVLINRLDYTGQRQIELAPGRYRLEVEKKGHESHNETIEIERNQILSRRISLEAHTGSLQFNITPGDARVRLRDQNRQIIRSWEGINIVRDVLVGQYTLLAEADGFETWRQDIEIAKNRQLQIQAEMNRIAFGNLVIQTNVSDAPGRLLRDDILIESWRGDARLNNIPFGTYTVHYPSHNDFSEWKRTIDFNYPLMELDVNRRSWALDSHFHIISGNVQTHGPFSFTLVDIRHKYIGLSHSHF